MAAPSPKISALVAHLDALGPTIDRAGAVAALAQHDVALDDVADFVVESPHAYSRVRVARTAAYELLVMTWRPGQHSVPHDHAGSICALRVLSGRVEEGHFAPARDGLVDAVDATELVEGELIVDQSEGIHALANPADAPERLVTLHLYVPPLPELRRFAPRPASAPIASAFTRAPSAETPVVAIVGGGFSGTLVAAQLVRRATEAKASVHVVVIDRQATFGEGPAYRTPDPRHLLNVPASNMSAWPDRPSDFLEWARTRDGATGPYDFLSRKLYGEYVRASLGRVVAEAGPGVSLEIRRAEVESLARGGRSRLALSGGTSLEADVVVLSTGHRPPDDPLEGRWRGSRSRYVEDPWATLVLSAIRPDERVVLLGTGLTAIDVVLSVTRTARSAPIVAISRRGLFPAAHAPAPLTPRDPRAWLEPILASSRPTARALFRALRVAAQAAEADGQSWRCAVDGLRPHLARIWQALPPEEARRFLRHARPFWEVHRHRMAPSIAAQITALEAEGTLERVAGRFVAAEATDDGVSVVVRGRGSARTRTITAEWVVNCTGPGAGSSLLSPVLRSLVDVGALEPDPHGLGVRCDAEGRALSAGAPADDLVIVGTLRKADLWESTAVPELRGQAASAAAVIARRFGWRA